MALTEAEFQQLLAQQDAARKLDAGEPKPVAASKPKRGMNGWESEYASILEARKRSGEVLWFQFEGMRLRLSNEVTFKPDFAVMLSSGELYYVETKGFIREHARIRLSVAADLFPFRFVLTRRRKVKDGGGWDERVFSSALDRLNAMKGKDGLR